MMAQGGGGTPEFHTYLVFNGTAYIDTDIVPQLNCSFTCGLGNETLHATQRLFGVPCENSSLISAIYNSSTNSSTIYFSVHYDSASSLSSSRTRLFSSGRYGFFMTPNGFGWSSTYYSYTKGNNAPSGAITIGSRPDHSGQAYTGKISAFRVYGADASGVNTYNGFDAYTPIVTLQPCIYNGEAGLWCEELHRFYGNSAGAGTLSVGD